MRGGAVGPRVLLGQRPDRGLAVGGEDSLQRPFLERLGRVLVGVGAGRRLGQVDLDDVERRAREQLASQLGVDHVVGRREHVVERADRGEVVVQREERARPRPSREP